MCFSIYLYRVEFHRQIYIIQLSFSMEKEYFVSVEKCRNQCLVREASILALELASSGAFDSFLLLFKKKKYVLCFQNLFKYNQKILGHLKL